MTNFKNNVLAFIGGVAMTGFLVWVILLASNFNGW